MEYLTNRTNDAVNEDVLESGLSGDSNLFCEVQTI